MLNYTSILFAILLLTPSVFAVNGVPDGAGTEEYPFQIADYEDLKIVQNDLNAYYRLVADIDASASRSENGQSGFIPIREFTGNFNGAGFSISGLYIYRSSRNVGLFGSISGAIIDSLALYGDVTGSDTTGLLVGKMEEQSIVRNSLANGRVSGNRVVGGFVGYVNVSSEVSNSYANVNVQAYYKGEGGGFVGILAGSSTIEKCYSTGQIPDGGGFIAKRAYNSSVRNSYWNRDLSHQTKSAGGTGLTNQRMKEESSYGDWDFTTTWEIEEGNTFPGLKGLNDAPFAVPDSFDSIPELSDLLRFLTNDVDLENNNVGVIKIVHDIQLNTKKDSLYISYVPGELTINNDTLRGVESHIAIPNDTIEIATYEELKKIGVEWEYPLVGTYKLVADIDAISSKVENNGLGFEPIGSVDEPFMGKFNGAGHVINGLFINRTSNHIGLFGKVEEANISNLGVVGDVSGEDYVGILVGDLGEASIINHVFTVGKVAGESAVGGVTGRNNGSIYTSYSQASVIGEYSIGGLVGFNDDRVSQSYSSGFVKASGFGGGLIGNNNRDGRVSSSYWSIDASGQSESDGGYGLTTLQMLDSNSFRYWDFGDEWEILQGESYPGLRSVDDKPFGIPDSYDSIPENLDFDQFLRNDLDVESGGAIDTVSKFAEYAHVNRSKDSVYIFYYSGYETDNLDTIVTSVTYVAVPNDTIEIRTYDELKLIGNHIGYPLYGRYKLLNTIDATPSKDENNGAGFNPIGSDTEPFTGVFQGAGHVIYGLYINRPGTSNVGLFGVVKSGIINDLGVKGTIRGLNNVATIAGKISHLASITKSFGVGIINGRENTGGLIGHSVEGSLITKSYSSGQVIGWYRNVGGLVGELGSSTVINNSYSTAGVAGGSEAGGLVGHTPNDEESYTIRNCYSAGIALSSEYDIDLGIDRGGVIWNGQIVRRDPESPTIVGNYWNVRTLGRRTLYYGTPLSNERMKMSSSFDGWDFTTIWEIQEGQTYPGLRDVDDMQFGMADSFGSLPTPQNYATLLSNDVDVDSESSGITVLKISNFLFHNGAQDSVYLIYFPGVVESANDTTWAGPSYVSVPRDTIDIDSYDELKKIGNEPNYPLFWSYRLTNDINASNSFAENNGKGFEPIGRSGASFTGDFDGGGHVIYNLYINRPDEDTVGLFGMVTGGKIRNVGVSGNLIADDYAGLLAGVIDSGATIQNSYTTGSIEAASYVGGLLGEIKNWSNIINCYSSVDVSATSSAGGLVGEQFIQRDGNTFGSHENSYSTGYVSSLSTSSGGIVGYDYDFISSTNIYWDINTSGKIQSAGEAEGLTTNSMKMQSSYTGWSFLSNWTILEGKSYPGLMMVNNAPMAFRDSIEVATTFALSMLLLNDYDIERYQEPLVVKVDSVFGIGTTDSITQFSFPNGTAEGVVDSIKYRVGEVLFIGDTLWGNYAIALFEQTLTNRAPIAEKDVITLFEDIEGSVDLATLILNDIDSPNETLTFDSIITSSVRVGSITINGDQMQYKPVENWNGLDTVEYVMSDGVFNDTGYVVFSVTPVNDAPVLTSINPQIIKEDMTITIVDTMLQARDIDGDSWSYIIEKKSGYSVSNNLITPDENFSGELMVPVSIFDGFAPSEKKMLKLTITPVNDAPIVTSVIDQTISEDNYFTLSDSMINVTDVDSDTLQTIFENGRHYTVTNNVITPSQNFNGDLFIPFRVTDGLERSGLDSLRLTVVPVNDAPVISSVMPQIIIEDASLNVYLSMVDVSDIDGDTLTLTLHAGAEYSIVNSVITPASNFHGTLVIPVHVTDGLLKSNVKEMLITVIPQNDVPAINSINPQTVVEGQALTIINSMVDFYDNDGDSLVQIIDLGNNYTVMGNTITPINGFSGELIVPIRMTDGVDTSMAVSMAITVTPRLSSGGQLSSSGMSGVPNTQSSGLTGVPDLGTQQSSIETVPGGGAQLSSSSADVSSNAQTPINTIRSLDAVRSGIMVSNVGSRAQFVQAPESAIRYSVYSIHGALIESGELYDDTVLLSDNAPRGVLYIQFE
ncbi:MAG: cadherin-like domain-containing protein [Fibrobacterales bacterium]